MSIDFSSDELLSLQQASQILPGRPHISTLHRWRLRGVRGQKLVTVLIGGRRYTSRRALSEFAIEGVKTTIPLHREILNHSSFVEAHVDTTFIERNWGKGQ